MTKNVLSMKINGWKYYNHALVSTSAPHEDPRIGELDTMTVWSMYAPSPLLIRYTTDFDCKHETGFWYIIKEGPFNMDNIEKKYKKNIIRALDRCEGIKINPHEYSEEMWEITKAAYAHYENADNQLPKEEFIKGLMNSDDDYWAAFNKENHQMAGWMSCSNNGDWTETKIAKYHPDLQGFNRPSDVLHYAVLNYYLNGLKQKYVCSGTRNINHKTNVQDYKIKNWKFRKAYCQLHIIYNPRIKWIVKCLFPIRGILHFFDGITIVHQINGLMKMEEIVRS